MARCGRKRRKQEAGNRGQGGCVAPRCLWRHPASLPTSLGPRPVVRSMRGGTHTRVRHTTWARFVGGSSHRGVRWAASCARGGMQDGGLRILRTPVSNRVWDRPRIRASRTRHHYHIGEQGAQWNNRPHCGAYRHERAEPRGRHDCDEDSRTIVAIMEPLRVGVHAEQDTGVPCA